MKIKDLIYQLRKYNQEFEILLLTIEKEDEREMDFTGDMEANVSDESLSVYIKE